MSGSITSARSARETYLHDVPLEWLGHGAPASGVDCLAREDAARADAHGYATIIGITML